MRPRPAFAAVALLVSASVAGAAEPARRDPAAVAAEIDKHIDARLATEKVPAPPAADDAEFLRRAYLDITGKLPTAQQAAAFLDDRAHGKRAKLIDGLLASPEYGRHFARTWRNLMVRPDANMPNPPRTGPLEIWLADHFNRGHGWDHIVSGILLAEGPAHTAPGTFFLLNGDGRSNPLANVTAGSVSTLFMGVQLSCAECHQHPFAPWKQTDFWGLAAFFGHVKIEGKSAITENRKARGGKRSIIINTGPKASIIIPDTSFKSVGQVIPARFPGGPLLTEGVDGPLRPALARWLTARDNPYFARNAANRLWAHFFGKALEGPLGEADGEFGPTHTAVLKLLARELADSGFDHKHLVRCLCNSKAYQRASRPARKEGDALFAQAAQRVLAPEVLHDALCSALELPALTLGKRDGIRRDDFLRAFTTRPEGEDPSEYAYGIPQALTLLNAPIFRGGGKAVGRLMREKKRPAEVIEGLYLATLSRRPSEEEAREAIAFVARGKSPEAGYFAVLWALINSSEFILNH